MSIVKIIAFSDSHGDKSTMAKVLNKNTDTDIVLFLGDGLREFAKLKDNYKKIQFYGVPGNNDWDFKWETSLLITIAKKKVLITHGHKFGVKLGIRGLLKEAKTTGADLVLYGHTHRAKIESTDNIVFVNPGSIGYTVCREPSYAEIIIDNSISGKIVWVEEKRW